MTFFSFPNYSDTQTENSPVISPFVNLGILDSCCLSLPFSCLVFGLQTCARKIVTTRTTGRGPTESLAPVLPSLARLALSTGPIVLLHSWCTGLIGVSSNRVSLLSHSLLFSLLTCALSSFRHPAHRPDCLDASLVASTARPVLLSSSQPSPGSIARLHGRSRRNRHVRTGRGLCLYLEASSLEHVDSSPPPLRLVRPGQRPPTQRPGRRQSPTRPAVLLDRGHAQFHGPAGAHPVLYTHACPRQSRYIQSNLSHATGETRG